MQNSVTLAANVARVFRPDGKNYTKITFSHNGIRLYATVWDKEFSAERNQAVMISGQIRINSWHDRKTSKMRSSLIVEIDNVGVIPKTNNHYCSVNICGVVTHVKDNAFMVKTQNKFGKKKEKHVLFLGTPPELGSTIMTIMNDGTGISGTPNGFKSQAAVRTDWIKVK